MQKKAKGWEELVNDGENYGGDQIELSPMEKIIFENIQDKTVLKIQDRYVFSKTGKVDDDHGRELAKLIAGFKCLDIITSLIITHNALGPEGVEILSQSSILTHIDYLHLGSNGLGDEGAKIVAQAKLFSQVKSLNLECNGIGAEGAKALANSPVLTQVSILNLVDNRVGDEGALAIANSDTLANLTYLHLGGNRVKSEEAKRALRESATLTQIKTLKVF